MIDYKEWVSAKALVVAKTTDGREWGRGSAIGYADQPTLLIQREDGTRFSWVAGLVERVERPTPAEVRSLIADLDAGCNDGGDLPDLLNRAARALEALGSAS